MCERFGVHPLIFDGVNDALFHEYNVNNDRHMEYVNDRGIFVDAPVDEIVTEMQRKYPHLMAALAEASHGATIADDLFQHK